MFSVSCGQAAFASHHLGTVGGMSNLIRRSRMSVTATIEDRTGPVRRFLSDRLGNVKAIRARMPTGPPLVPKLTSGPLTGTVGTAFDYRLRFLWNVDPAHTLVAA